MARMDWRGFAWSSLGEGWARDLRVAAIFFTALPFGRTDEITGPDIGHALRAAPIIGLLTGLAGGVAYAVASGLGLAPPIAALLALAVTIGATGALHEDGLADLADGLGGRDPSARLDIMRDSRLGGFGALALLFSVGLRAAAIAAIGGSGAALLALAASGAAARGLIPLVTLYVGPARPDGLGAMLGQQPQEVPATALALGLLAAIVLLGPVTGLVAVALAAAAVASVAELARRRLGGYTGDVLGAAEQVAEIVLLLAAAAR